MNPILQNMTGMTGMNAMTDQVIATDLLMSAKSGVINYSRAVTETATPEVRAVLRHQLEEAVVMHEQVTAYMMSRGWYHPYNPAEQLQLDMQMSNTALSLAQK
jgi:similar to spore coat protein